MQMEAVQAQITGHEMQAKTKAPADSFHGKNPRQSAGTVHNSIVRQKFQPVREGYQHSQQEVNVKYQNKDGDSLEVSESAQSLSEAKEGEGNSNVLKNPFHSVSELIKQFIQNQIQKLAEFSMESQAQQVGKSEIKLPEVSEVKENAGNNSEVQKFWNARNIAERMAKFAVAFHGKSGQESTEFAKEAVTAVKKGFEVAGTIQKGLGKEVNSLTSEIKDTVIENIEAWAGAKEFEGFATAA